MENKLRIGTRKSKLALKQTDLVVQALHREYPQWEVELVPMHTRGDRILDKPLYEIGDKGLFASEFEQMLLRDEIDIAVHSGKDLPIFLAEGLAIIGVPKRDDHRDVLVTRGMSAEDCRIIGTGSLRRKEYCSRYFPQAQCRLLRGNINTRLEKLQEGEFDGIILAKAGLDRLEISKTSDFTFHILSDDTFLPAPCQGIIVVEGRPEWANKIGKITHKETALMFETERLVLGMLNIDCSEPVAAYATLSGETIHLRAMYAGKEAEGAAPASERLALVTDIVRRLRG